MRTVAASNRTHAIASREDSEPLDPQVIQILRQMTTADRMQRMLEMNDYVRSRVAAHLQARHPDWSPERIHGALLQRLGYATG